MYFVNTVAVEQRFPTWDTPDFHPFMIYTKIFNKNVLNNFEYSQGNSEFYFIWLWVREQKKGWEPLLWRINKNSELK